jgi:F0F1-type ATP synthase assembly protein I
MRPEDNEHTESISQTGSNGSISERPDAVDLAVEFIWGILGLSVISKFILLYASEFPVFVLVIGVVQIAFLVVVNRMIAQGSNWSRMAFLITYCVSLANFAISFPDPFILSPVFVIIGGLQLLLGISALFQLFTEPGKSWSIPRKEV